MKGDVDPIFLFGIIFFYFFYIILKPSEIRFSGHLFYSINMVEKS
jgi:hypothetical protein